MSDPAAIPAGLRVAAEAGVDAGSDAGAGTDAGAEPDAGPARLAGAVPSPQAWPTTRDALLGGAIRLRQPARGYRVAVDAVLLAAAVPAGPGMQVLELGTGVGAAALCLAHRVPGCRIAAVELQPQLAALARDNVERNGLAGRVRVIEADLRSLPGGAGGVAPGAWDQVLANPPFMPVGGTPSPDPVRARAVSEIAGTLQDWVDAALAALRQGGGLTLIHRADRLDAALAALHPRAGAVEVIPLWPRQGMGAQRVILRARKGIRAPALLHPGLVLHRPEGGFTAAAEAVLRGGAALHR